MAGPVDLGPVQNKIKALSLYAYQPKPNVVEFGRLFSDVKASAETAFGKPLIERKVTVETAAAAPEVSRSEPTLAAAAAASSSLSDILPPSSMSVPATAANATCTISSKEPFTFEQISSLVSDTLTMLEKLRVRLRTLRKTNPAKPAAEWAQLLKETLETYNAQITLTRTIERNFKWCDAVKVGLERDKLVAAIDTIFLEVQTFHFSYVYGKDVETRGFKLYSTGAKKYWSEVFGIANPPQPLPECAKTEFPPFLTLDESKPLRKYLAETPSQPAQEAKEQVAS